MQVLDDGRITDGQGRTVDFKNTVVILTSNLGSAAILDGIDDNGDISEQAKGEVNRLLKTAFRPEFLNRLDEIVFFKPLTKTEIAQIVRLMSEDLVKRLQEKQLRLQLTDEAVAYIAEQGYDPLFGARQLKRFIQHGLETLLAKNILSGGYSAGDSLVVGVDEKGLTVTKNAWQTLPRGE